MVVVVFVFWISLLCVFVVVVGVGTVALVLAFVGCHGVIEVDVVFVVFLCTIGVVCVCRGFWHCWRCCGCF